MKNVIKDVFSRICGFLIVGLLIYTFFTPNSNAATYVSASRKDLGWTSQQMLEAALIKMDNEDVFCIQPGYQFSTTDPYEVITQQPSWISNEIISKLALCSFYGTQLRTGDAWYITAQSLIWFYMGESWDSCIVDFKNGSTNEGMMIELQQLVESHALQPSFHEETIHLKKGESITLKDTHQVLDRYDIVSSQGLVVQKNGYELTITLTDDTYESIDLQLTHKANAVQGPHCYYTTWGTSIDGDDGWQRCAKFGDVEDVFSSLTVQVIKQGTLACVKKDASNNLLKGDATLAHAIYGIYDESNRLIEEIESNENGIFPVITLPYGTYHLQEIQAPVGYLLSDRNYTVTLSETNVHVDLTLEDALIMSPIQLKKVAVHPLTSEKYAIEDIQFEIKLKSEVENVGWEEATLYDTITTNRLGQALSKPLPYGTYLIKEINTPSTLLPSSVQKVIISTHSEDPITQLEINNEPYLAYIEIVKKDRQTQKVIQIADARFKIFDVRTQSYLVQNNTEVWSTDQTGKIKLPEPLPVGQYQIEEIEAPSGYLISEQPISFEIIKNENTQLTTLSIDVYNDPIQSQVRFTKEGKVLTSFKESQTSYGTLYTPIFETKTIRQAVLSIYANEDIYVNHQLVYKKDELVESLISSTEAVLSSSLPYGKYYARETSAPDGFLLDQNTHYFEVKDKKITDLTIFNDRPTISLAFSKAFENQSSQDTSIFKDVVFGIFTEVPISLSPNQELAKDSLIYLCSLDDQGKFLSKIELPEGHYYLKELQTNDLYLLDETKYPFVVEVLEENQDEILIQLTTDTPILNQRKTSSIEIIKVDQTNKNILLENAVFTLFDENMVEISTETTNASGTVIFENVPLGKYYLKETSAPENYEVLKEMIEINLTKEFDLENIYHLTVSNQMKQQMTTSDLQNISLYYHAFLLSMMGCCYFSRKAQYR